MKKFGIIGTILLVIVGIAFIFRMEILNLPMTILVSDDQPEKQADYILIMMGSVGDRAHHGSQLYKKGYGKKIIFAEAQETEFMKLGFRMKDGEATKTYLSMLGVPEDDVVFISNSSNSSSFEEVKLILQYIKENDPHAKRAILVTSWYHSSRATWIMNKSNDTDLVIQSSPSPMPPTWWRKEADFLRVFSEYLKWVYYLVKY